MAQVIAAYGVQSTIAYLRRFERDAFKEIQKDLKNASQPLVKKVADQFPAKPMSNWTQYGRTQRGRKPAGQSGSTFPRYQITKVRKAVSADAGSSRRRTDGSYNILRIKQTNAAGAIYDLAKNSESKQGTQFVQNMNRHHRGKPNSRIMHPVVNKNKHLIMKDVNKIVNGVEKQFSAQIAADTMSRNQASARAMSQARNALGRFGA
jgi:hypothetical protein